MPSHSAITAARLGEKGNRSVDADEGEDGDGDGGEDSAAEYNPHPSILRRRFTNAPLGDEPEAKKKIIRFRRMSSIVTESFALIDAVSEDPTSSSTQAAEWRVGSSGGGGDARSFRRASSVRRAASARRRVGPGGGGGTGGSIAADPFVSSLGKSIEILRRSPASQGVIEDDVDGDESDSWEDSAAEGKGAAPPPAPPPAPQKASRRARLSTVLHLSAFSVLGESLRIFLGHLLGGDCVHPESTWVATTVAALNLCVTSDDDAASAVKGGGALFADLPANMFGSFLMGCLQPSSDLDLLHSQPISFLPAQHWFQGWTVVHLGLRTGFCGSLTTFASWNTDMVALMDGYTSGGAGSQVVSALFGYVIGLELAAASLAFGQTVAVWMHRRANGQFAKEEDMMAFAFSKSGAGAGGDDEDDGRNAVQKPLPDYERRYLAYLLPREEMRWAERNVSALEDLERWKVSTDCYRFEDGAAGDYGNDNRRRNLLDTLHEIERLVLVDEAETLSDEQRRISGEEGWDVDALIRFAGTAGDATASSSVSSRSGRSTSSTALGKSGITDGGRPRCGCAAAWRLFLAALPFVLAVSIVAAFVALDLATPPGDDGRAVLYRKVWLSAVAAPAGTLVRWKLSRRNGSLSGRLGWFPAGTFAANAGASVLSAACEGLAVSSRPLGDGAGQVLYALKTGFAGCMSTVSTFVVEGHLLQRSYPQHAKAHLYMVGSLAVACALGLVVYSPLVRSGPV